MYVLCHSPMSIPVLFSGNKTIKYGPVAQSGRAHVYVLCHGPMSIPVSFLGNTTTKYGPVAQSGRAHGSHP